ncbi:hypothetical protein [Halalkalibacillus halophilus]|nr:hypothetical protein [Halalkalibacillus halophilus]
MLRSIEWRLTIHEDYRKQRMLTDCGEMGRYPKGMQAASFDEKVHYQPD